MKNNFIIGLSSILFEDKKYSDVSSKLKKIFENNDIDFDLIENTKDIWVRDFMPIITLKNNIVAYNYNPDYLKSKKHEKLKTDISEVTINNKKITIDKYSKIVLDGGNFTYNNDTVIMTDKIYTENKHISEIKEDINTIIKNDFDIKNIIIVPQIQDDTYGHTDSMVRFIDEHTLLINDFSYETSDYRKKLDVILKNTALKLIYLTYSENFFNGKRNWGAYLNYLEINNVIIVPTYGIKEDSKILKQFNAIFPNKKIEKIQSSDIIKEGGALNCISSYIRNP